MIRTSRLPPSMAALHNNPRHSRESDYMGFWGKKNSSGACAPLCHADFALALFSFFFSVLLFYKRFDVLFSRLFFFRFLIQSVIQSHIQTVKRSVIRSVTRSVIRSVIRSGPDFIDAKLKQSRTYQVRCRVEDFNPEPSALITILIGFWRWLAG